MAMQPPERRAGAANTPAKALKRHIFQYHINSQNKHHNKQAEQQIFLHYYISFIFYNGSIPAMPTLLRQRITGTGKGPLAQALGPDSRQIGYSACQTRRGSSKNNPALPDI